MGRISYIADMEEWTREFSYYYPVRVRFSETDMFGHLNNTVPFTYFELARIEFFKHIGFMQDWVSPNSETIPVVADLQCDFLKQVFFDEEIKIHVKANRTGTSSVDLHYMGKNENGEVCFTGRGTMVQFSKKTGKGVPWTDSMKKLLEAR
ncbi:acyl-CoA thioesterase [Neobacillus notoginsengisoli]|uniref:Acyl-CoA thioesterase n=1 Tax=Neobacillus notoginsengisoli TaxID=1578198 RepID=A0A417YU88_9BACI|nr:thioesterase family protein [Neobacillus notoginsengisoli]RHW40675.1 acyl-CoA thioesterase [Neobacillus notoginsengisoli]